MTQRDTISPVDLLIVKEVPYFLKAVEDFCLFIEQYESESEYNFLNLALKHLLSLYNNLSNLPFITGDVECETEVTLSSLEFERIQLYVAERMPFQTYWTVLNTLDTLTHSDSPTGNIVHNLSCIYKEVKTVLLRNNLCNNLDARSALQLFKSSFDRCWSDHCLHALFAIHCYLQRHYQ